MTDFLIVQSCSKRTPHLGHTYYDATEQLTFSCNGVKAEVRYPIKQPSYWKLACRIFHMRRCYGSPIRVQVQGRDGEWRRLWSRS